MTEKFCLKWNDFESNIRSAFQLIRDERDFFDIVLACDDDADLLSAHKVILSACSPFFKQVLKRHPHQYPLLYLKGVRSRDMQSVLNFMYHGEVNVAQDELNSFLQVAEDLKVKGLTSNNKTSSPTKTSTGSRSETVHSPLPPVDQNQRPSQGRRRPSSQGHISDNGTISSAKRFRPDYHHHNPVSTSAVKATPSPEDEDDIQEVVQVKSEQIAPMAPLNDVGDGVTTAVGVDNRTTTTLAQSQNSGTLAMYEEEESDLGMDNYDDGDAAYQEDYDQSEYTEQNYLVQGTDGSAEAFCSICRKYLSVGNRKRHWNDVHGTNTQVSCHVCGKMLKNNSGLKGHLRTVHGIYQKMAL